MLHHLVDGVVRVSQQREARARSAAASGGRRGGVGGRVGRGVREVRRGRRGVRRGGRRGGGQQRLAAGAQVGQRARRARRPPRLESQKRPDVRFERVDADVVHAAALESKRVTSLVSRGHRCR